MLHQKKILPLEESITDILTTYFNHLDGSTLPKDLHSLIIKEVERPLFNIVVNVISQGNQTKAADILGISRSTLRKKLQEHNLV